ncbi:hypothetical protein [Corynebacterium pseudodiphtheriticum]|uniref:hypothetical protein n=1 Tax=Corynebacterium pseudodiphtheriticum TaxID=37637 RepID=UPI0025410252|nr:hypothetical protein [Corynebacterium pseudodiphtheriticum]MDK4286967.1 hypothetical protein [Corynebacterium pseudodiphtheriticum]
MKPKLRKRAGLWELDTGDLVSTYVHKMDAFAGIKNYWNRRKQDTACDRAGCNVEGRYVEELDAQFCGYHARQHLKLIEGL